MSFQQFPPAGDPGMYGGPPPVVQQPASPFAPQPRPAGRRKGLIATGALVLAAGVVAGVVMISASGKNYDESVQNLARAPLGCTTALQFDEAGTYTVYVETVGSIGDVRGDCPNADSDYEFSGDELPDVDVTLVDEDGDEVDLDDESSKDYDAGGRVGESIATIQIDRAGDYDMTVSSDDDDFAIAVGKNPKDGADSLKTNGIIALIVGVVLGGLLLLLGLRKRSPAPPAPVPPSTPYGGPAQQTWAPMPPAAPAPPFSPAPPVTWPPAAPPAAPPVVPPPGPHNWPAPPTT
jgi:hypothetical protein